MVDADSVAAEGLSRRLFHRSEGLCNGADGIASSHVGSCREGVGETQFSHSRERRWTALHLVAENVLDAFRALSQFFEPESGLSVKLGNARYGLTITYLERMVPATSVGTIAAGLGAAAGTCPSVSSNLRFTACRGGTSVYWHSRL